MKTCPNIVLGEGQLYFLLSFDFAEILRLDLLYSWMETSSSFALVAYFLHLATKIYNYFRHMHCVFDSNRGHCRAHCKRVFGLQQLHWRRKFLRVHGISRIRHRYDCV